MKRFFVSVMLLLFIFSCTVRKDKNENGSSPAESIEKKYPDQLIYLDSAEDMYNILCQGWVMEDDEEALEDMREDSKFEIAYRSFYMAANGSFVKNPRNAIIFGNWHYDDANKTITFNNDGNGGKDVYKIVKLAYDELTLRNIGINTVTNLKLISTGRRFKDPLEEPFAIENNRWRMPPGKKETDSAIKQRLKENLHFFILFYRSAILKDDKHVSFWGLPSCLKWYGGGIFLKKPEELRDNWIECFYNKDQAMKAYLLAERLLSRKYEWPKGEHNWLKLNLAVLEQMYKKIDEMN